MLVDFAELDSLASDALLIAVTALSAGMLIAALWTSAASGRLIALAAVVGVVTVIAAIGATISSGIFHPSFGWVALLALAPLIVVRKILSHLEVTLDTILGAISAYLLIALASRTSTY